MYSQSHDVVVVVSWIPISAAFHGICHRLSFLKLETIRIGHNNHFSNGLVIQAIGPVTFYALHQPLA